jgi:hypothetical protein
MDKPISPPPHSLGMALPDKLNGPQAFQERQKILKTLQEIETRLLNQTRGEGVGSALVNDLDSESLKTSRLALSTVRHAIHIMDNVSIKPHN